MKKIFFALLFSSSVSVSADYAQVFDRGIFEQDGLALDASLDLIVDHLHERKRDQLYKSKTFTDIATKRYNLEVARVYQRYRGLFISLVGVAALAVQPLAGGAIILYGMYDNSDIPMEDLKLLVQQCKLTNNLFSGPIYELEKDYVVRKRRIGQTIQKRIEDELLGAYQDGLNNEACVKDLINFPTTAKVLLEGDVEAFLKARNEGEERLGNRLCERLQNTKDVGTSQDLYRLLADADQIGERACRYICAQDEGTVLAICIDIANSLQKPYFLVRASEALDTASTCGDTENRGLFLEPFFVTNSDGENFLNPIVIITNANEWLKKPKTALLLKDFIDEKTENTIFQSAYLEIDIDFRKVSVLCIGSCRTTEFENYIKSRLDSFIWSDSGNSSTESKLWSDSNNSSTKPKRCIIN